MKQTWNDIPSAAQEHILDKVWCSNCRSSRRIRDFTNIAEDGYIHLQGFCSVCGHAVARIVETDG